MSKLTDKDGKTIKEYKAEKVRKVISSKTASEMRKIMEYVVSEGGGGNAKIAGYRIGGKTGTANKAKNGKYTSDTFSSFVGMAPMDDPKIAVLVVNDTPKGDIRKRGSGAYGKRIPGRRSSIYGNRSKLF